MNLFKSITKRIKSFLNRHQSQTDTAVDDVQDTHRWTASQSPFQYTEKVPDQKSSVSQPKPQKHKTTAERRKAISDYYETHSIDDTVELVHEPSNFIIGCFFEFHKMTKLEWIAQQNNVVPMQTHDTHNVVKSQSNIPKTVKTLPKPVKSKQPKRKSNDVNSDKTIQIANYYANHTIDETKKEFHVNNNRIVKAFKDTHNGVSKNNWTLNGDISSYYEDHSLTDVIDKFNLQSQIIQSIFMDSHSGVAKDDWLKQQAKSTQIDTKSISDYYANHSLQETIQKFYVSDKIVKDSFEQFHDGATKLEWRNKKKGKQVNNANKKQANTSIKDHGIRPYVKGKVYNPNIKSDIIAYRKTHSLIKTSKFFGMSTERIEHIYHKEISDYYLTHSIDETANQYQIGQSTVSKYFEQAYGMSKRNWIKQNEKGEN